MGMADGEGDLVGTGTRFHGLGVEYGERQRANRGHCYRRRKVRLFVLISQLARDLEPLGCIALCGVHGDGAISGALRPKDVAEVWRCVLTFGPRSQHGCG